MTAADFRRMALGLPETEESRHMGHPDFRVRGKVFATLGYPGGGWGMVKLAPRHQKLLEAAQPGAFVPAQGAWGRQGCTCVLLKTARRQTVGKALASAWSRLATAELVRRLDAPSLDADG